MKRQGNLTQAARDLLQWPGFTAIVAETEQTIMRAWAQADNMTEREQLHSELMALARVAATFRSIAQKKGQG